MLTLKNLDLTKWLLKVRDALAEQDEVRRSLFCDDTETDPRVDQAACQRLGARSMIAVPLLDRGKAVGLLEVFSATAHAFDENDIRHLDLLAKMTVEAMAERCHLLREQADTPCHRGQKATGRATKQFQNARHSVSSPDNSSLIPEVALPVM
jgi:transcriptional regulator with GAF, ATPase, and Fis domain